MDMVDITTRNTDVLTDAALAHHRAQQTSHTHTHHGEVRYCIDCGAKIDPRRLDAVPNAVRCVRCQSEYEQNFK